MPTFEISLGSKIVDLITRLSLEKNKHSGEIIRWALVLYAYVSDDLRNTKNKLAIIDENDNILKTIQIE